MSPRRSPSCLLLLVVLLACDELPRATCRGEGQVHTIDVNNDGRPDIRTVTGEHTTCRETDLDFDGRPDTIQVSDAQGRLKWIGHDFDRDGRIDDLEERDGDTIVQKLIDLDGDGHPDRRLRYRDGKPIDAPTNDSTATRMTP